MDTEEMYRRGVADAEHGEPHPFYYQHYYQYRRGYDRMRRRLGLPGGFHDIRRRQWARAILAVVTLLAAVTAVVTWRGRAPPSAGRAPSPAPAPTTAPALPTRTPIFATPTPEPTAAPPTLHSGGGATIANTQGAHLRGRRAPGVDAAVTVSFKEGEQVRILEGPVEADGLIWWKLEGTRGAGWSAQQSKEGVVWLQPASGQ